MTPSARVELKDPAGRAYQSYDALMSAMAESGRTGTREVLQIAAPGAQWSAFQGAIDAGSSQRIAGISSQRLDAETSFLVERAIARLARQDPRHDPVGQYKTCIEAIDRARSAAQLLIASERLAAYVHTNVVWFSAWHLLGAYVPASDVIQLLNSGSPLNAQRPQARHSPTLSVAPEEARVRWVSPTQARVFLGYASRAASVLASVASWRQHMLATTAAHKAMIDQRKREMQREREQADADRRAADALKFKPRSSEDVAPYAHLNGQALRTPVVGTWLVLVAFSWVSLLWGAIISTPFGIGLGIFASLGAGIIVVPLWGTVFGFLGMDYARDSTLHQMGFRDLPEGHVLRGIAANYCQSLDIPLPRLGTIDAFNAFAMGSHCHDATVALGRPLIDTLTPHETAAVLAHELGHVVSGDMRKMMLMRTFQNATVWFAIFQGVKQIARWCICWAAEFYILAFSRKREYWADAIGAALAGKEAMIGALRKLDQGPRLSIEENAHSLFMVRGKPLSTHPSSAERITALEQETYMRHLPLRPAVE